MKYVAYYRVSTDKQGQSGLGLDGQDVTVKNHIDPEKIYREFTEIESGKKNDRPILKQAIELCKSENATLVIAKLDRLSRNVYFISQLMESGIKFICCDMPTATDFTIHIYSAMAQEERRLISKRTKDALEELQKRGVKLGNPQNLTSEARNKGVEVRVKIAQENENNIRAKAYLKAINGTLQQKAILLNENGFRTSKGKLFTPMQVKRLQC
jgi:DNA invertase Pin-like site-specific DNA recombinase